MFNFLYYGYDYYTYRGIASGDIGYLIFIALFIAALIISAVGSVKVKTTYNKFRNVPNSVGMTGAQAARAILDSRGLYNVGIVPIAGELTDNYNPTNNIVSLSTDVYNGTSIAAVGIAAHEVGHAIQHNEGYAPVKLRTALVPVVNLGSKFSWPLLIIGLLLMSLSNVSISIGYYIAVFGLILFALSTLFYLVTYPVETNASRRALKQLQSVVALPAEDAKGVRKVLKAAAMTYLGALLTSLANLLRFVLMVRSRRRRRR